MLLNPDANAPLVKNGDGTGPLADTAIDNVGNVVLSNAVLTNNALSNNVLTNNALSNNALTNAVLSNVVLSNAVLSNLDPANAVLSNDPLSNNALTNNALSNVVLSNAVLSNNALSNAVLSNVVLSNNALNAALTNLDPANVALSNAVLSNNALTNVVLSNLDPNNALSNAMLTNNALTNAVLSNVVLSNNALSNNALSNNVLSNVVLSNAPLGDGANGGDPDALSTIETGAVEIAKNSFQTGDLANSNFKETTFTIRNRGNIDTILAIKLMLRDAVCTGAPNYTCTPPPGYKLQLVLRKVALVPVAIPPTGTRRVHGSLHPGRDRTGEHRGVERLRPAADRPERPELREVPARRPERCDAVARGGRVRVRDDQRDRRRRRDPAGSGRSAAMGRQDRHIEREQHERSARHPDAELPGRARRSSRSTPRRRRSARSAAIAADHRRSGLLRQVRERRCSNGVGAPASSARRSRQLLHRHGGADRSTDRRRRAAGRPAPR